MSSADPKKPEPNLWVRELTNGIEEGGRLLGATCYMVRNERRAPNGGTKELKVTGNFACASGGAEKPVG